MDTLPARSRYAIGAGFARTFVEPARMRVENGVRFATHRILARFLR